MQRFLREPGHGQTAALASAYDEKVSVIQTYFPPNIAAVYAIPKHGSDRALEWWTEQTGNVQAYHSLPQAQQRALLAAYDAQQQAVGKLADELEQRGYEDQARHARSLIGPAAVDSLYSVEGHPLLTRWASSSPAPHLVTPAPAALPSAATPIVRRWWPWLLLLALLMLLLLGWLIWCWWPKQTAIVALPDPTPVCTEIVAPTPEQTRNIPEFAVILDTSGSMALNIGTPSGLDQEIFNQREREGVSHFSEIQDPRYRQWVQGPSRGDVAIQTLDGVLGELPSGVSTRFITFEQKQTNAGCQRPMHHGIFTANDSPRLKKLLYELRFVGGTPLASTLAQTAGSLDGKQRDAVILMFVDGNDGCDQNICATAQSIATSQPRLKVNVVDISGTGLANCVAELTGGKVFASQDAVEIKHMVQQASAPVRAAAMVCHPAGN